MERTILIISGEESGDLHGSLLIKALKRLLPSLRVMGMGGEKMRAAGLEGLDSRDVSVVGIAEVVEKFPQIVRSFRTLKRLLDKERFDCVVLIDFPDFNLRFAKEAGKRGVPVIYYISPQVWAWRRGRIRKIARLVDRMLVVFPFELELYRDAGVDVEYVGHPLGDIARCNLTKEEARKALGIDSRDTVVALLPGSRVDEVRRLLPVMMDAVGIVEKELDCRLRLLLPAARSIGDDVLSGLLSVRRDVRVLRGGMYESLRASDAALVASGTATLETALLGTPMVIVYRMSVISYIIGRLMVGVKNIGLPNIVLGRTVVPELIQGEANARRMAGELAGLLSDHAKREAMASAFGEIRERLSPRASTGAADRAAEAVFRFIESRRSDNTGMDEAVRSSGR